MKFYRHLALVSPFVKIFLCFILGFAFEGVFIHPYPSKPRSRLKKIISSAFILIIGIAFFIGLFRLSNNYSFARKKIFSLVEPSYNIFDKTTREIIPVPGLPSLEILLDKEVLSPRLRQSAFWALVIFLVLGIWPMGSDKKYCFPLLIIILALHSANIFTYKFSELKLKTISLDQNLQGLTLFQAMPYARRRDPSFEGQNPRKRILNALTIETDNQYWSIHSFLFKDEIGNSFRTDHWLLPLNDYMKTYWGQPLEDLSTPPHGFQAYIKLFFPVHHPAVQKISGLTEDKIQFFSSAFSTNDEERIASLLPRPEYTGDILFMTSPQNEHTQALETLLEQFPMSLTKNERRHLLYEIKRFDANHLEVLVKDVPAEGGWLLYSDVWHPFWKVKVNGRPAHVYQANLAYKAVFLNPGDNKVHFYFHSSLMSWIQILLGWNSLFWVGFMMFLGTRVVFPKQESQGGGVAYGQNPAVS
jgi:hypothetical protein